MRGLILIAVMLLCSTRPADANSFLHVPMELSSREVMSGWQATTLAQLDIDIPPHLRDGVALFEVEETCLHNPSERISQFLFRYRTRPTDPWSYAEVVGGENDLRHAEAEVDWLLDHPSMLLPVADTFGRSFVDEGREFILGMWDVVKDLFNDPKGMLQELKDIGQELVAWAQEYYKAYQAGEVDMRKDLAEFRHAFLSNKRAEVAHNRMALDLTRLVTTEAHDAVSSLAWAEIGGETGFTIASLFVAYASAKYVGQLVGTIPQLGGKGASTVVVLSSADDVEPGLREAARFPKIFRHAHASLRMAEQRRMPVPNAVATTAARMARFRQVLDPRSRIWENPNQMHRTLNQVLRQMQVVENRGGSIDEFLDELLPRRWDDMPSVAGGSIIDTNLERRALKTAHAQAKQWELFDERNMHRMNSGQAPKINAGPYKDEIVEWDHRVPVRQAPELAHSIANRQLLPKSANRAKGAKITDESIKLLVDLSASKKMSAERVSEIIGAAVAPR